MRCDSPHESQMWKLRLRSKSTGGHAAKTKQTTNPRSKSWIDLGCNPPKHNLKQADSESEILGTKVMVIHHKGRQIWFEQGHLAKDSKQQRSC